MAAVVNLQAQVESVLGALVKAATVELTKLFESRYRASALDMDAVRAEDGKRNAILDSSSTGDTTRSIGVQVDDDINPPSELSGPPLLSDGDCKREGVEGPLVPSEILLDEEKSPVDPEWLPLREQVVAETTDMGAETTDMGAETTDMGAETTDTTDVVAETTDMTDVGAETTDMMTDVVAETTDMGAETTDTTVLVAETTELSEVYSPADGDPQTEVVLHVSAEAWSEALRHGSTQSSPAKPKPLIIQPDTRDIVSGQKVKFVCPLIFKPESPTPKPDDVSVKPEPTQVSVSTARGTAYSPSPSDGAVTPAQVGVWERIHTPKETKNNLHIKLKLTSPDQKLTRPCAVQLVDVIKGAIAKGHVAKGHDAKHKTGWPLPKDLRRHQGVHTGHRLCCFTACDNGVWRLQKVVTHSRDGYPCGICGKTFKRRKILRRHARFHTGEKPYSCTTCRKCFALRKSLRRHARFHTGQRPHTCTHCGKSFRLRDNLKAHLRFHTGEKPYSCPTCGKMFRIVKNLEKHRLSECEVFVPSFRTIAGLQQRNNGGQ